MRVLRVCKESVDESMPNGERSFCWLEPAKEEIPSRPCDPSCCRVEQCLGGRCRRMPRAEPSLLLSGGTRAKGSFEQKGGEPKRKWSPPATACLVLFLPAVYFSCSVREIFFLLKETVNVSPGPKPLPSRFFADRVRVFLLPILTTGFLTVFVRRVLFTR